MTDRDSSTGRDSFVGRDSSADRPSLAERRDLPDVYQPAEDSHLLATTASDEVDEGEGVRALDVGTGSGYVAGALAERGAAVVGSDLSPLACEQAREGGVPVVRANLLDPFRDGSFDLVTFNPPYLPTPEDREWSDWMERALSGGEDGRRLVEPFLDDLGRTLAPGGRALLLVSSLADIDAVRKYARERGLATTVVAEEKHPYERLVVLRLTRE